MEGKNPKNTWQGRMEEEEWLEYMYNADDKKREKDKGGKMEGRINLHVGNST